MKAIQSTPLEQSIMGLHTDNPENREWFFGTVVSILEDSRLPFFTKADRLASALSNIDARVDYVKEQIRLLQHLKKQLEVSRTRAKEEIAKALESFGIDRLEGVQVSSITVTPAKETSKTSIRILDEDALIKAGYFTLGVDKDAVEEALCSADQRYEVEDYVDAIVEPVHKPASIRINRRRSLPNEPVQIDAV